MSDPCEHAWYEKALGQPCPFCENERLLSELERCQEANQKLDRLYEKWMGRWQDEQNKSSELQSRLGEIRKHLMGVDCQGCCVNSAAFEHSSMMCDRCSALEATDVEKQD